MKFHDSRVFSPATPCHTALLNLPILGLEQAAAVASCATVSSSTRLWGGPPGETMVVILPFSVHTREIGMIAIVKDSKIVKSSTQNLGHLRIKVLSVMVMYHV